MPVAGPVATYSLLLLLVEEEPGVVLPGVDALELPGAVLLELLELFPPGTVLVLELELPGVRLLDVLVFALIALPLLVVQAPFAAKV